jgi:succinoglycan biosynthesis transport protein ExoP
VTNQQPSEQAPAPAVERLLLEREASGFDPRRLRSVIRRRLLLIVGIPLLLVAVSIARSVTTDDEYESSARIVVESAVGEQLDTTDGDVERLLLTESQVVISPTIQNAVRTALGRDVSYRVDVGFNNNLLTIVATADDPAVAAEDANAVADTYLTTRRERIAGELSTTLAQLRTRVTALNTEANTIAAKITPATGTAPAVTLNQIDQSRLTTVQAQLAATNARIADLELQANVNTGGMRLAVPAVADDDPVAPKPVRDAVLFGVVGLLIGALAAYVREQTSDKIHTVEDLEQILPGVPVLATVPYTYTLERLAVVNRSASPTAEAFRTLRAVLEMRPDTDVVQFTSVREGDGASFVVGNVVGAFGVKGTRLTVVDADLRSGELGRRFLVGDEPNLATIHTKGAHVAIETARGFPSVAVLPSGAPVGNPDDVLVASTFGLLVKNLAADADNVVIDTPPVLSSADALTVSQFVDAVVVVCACNRTRRRDLRRAVTALRTVRAPIIGLVLTRAR